MSSVPVDLIAYLDPLVSETAGVDLVEGPPMELPDAQVAITHYGGEPALGRVMGASLSADGLVEVALVQLFVRNMVMATAKTKADAYYALLDNFNGVANGRTYYHIESTDSMPYSIGQDGNGRWRYVCNFRCQHKRT